MAECIFEGLKSLRTAEFSNPLNEPVRIKLDIRKIVDKIDFQLLLKVCVINAETAPLHDVLFYKPFNGDIASLNIGEIDVENQGSHSYFIGEKFFPKTPFINFISDRLW